MDGMKIHFICRGNILRSVIAEAYLKSLNLDIAVRSSGTNVNWEDPSEKEHFANSMKLLERHGIKNFAKKIPEQLTQAQVNDDEIVVCMNQRVIDEARELAHLPQNTINWEITDIGEAHRIVPENRELYEEEIYTEITSNVSELVKELGIN